MSYSLSLIAFSCSLLLVACSGTRPTSLGVQEGKLAPCPKSPNCISSQGADEAHAVDPLRFASTAREAMTKLTTIIRGMPRTKIITETGNYLHVEFTSLIFRFVDDVEFYLDEGNKLIHVRSASRLGKSDLGVNRKRIEAVREEWSKAK